MKHGSFLVILAALPVIGGAQTSPPTPPTQPTQPAQPPVVTPVTPMAPLPSVKGWIDPIQIDDIKRNAEEFRVQADKFKYDVEKNFAQQKWVTNVPFEFDSKFDFHFDPPHFDMPSIDMPSINIPPIDVHVNVPSFDNFHVFGDAGPRQAWVQGDPADSLYRQARETILRNDYSKAASQFADLVTRYPGSRYAPDAVYWEAFARYRVGTVEQLRLARKALDANANRFDYMQRKSDVPALRARILRALADRGDAGADDDLKKLYAQYPNVCDDEKMSLKSTVLNSMYQMDPDGSLPQVRQILETRDACSAQLRRTAVFLLANRPDEQRAAIIASVAKNDTVREVRRAAIEALSRMPGDASMSALADLMKDTSEDIQSSAVRALMRSDNPKARAAMRTLIDRKESPERQRVEAIQSFDRDMSPDDAAYLRQLYGREQSDRVKDAIIYALSRTSTEDNTAFLLNIAKNTGEPSNLRASALNRISRMNLSVDDLSKLYDATDSRSMRNSLVRALGNRKEDAAVNKLLEIVKLSTDPDVQTNAMRVLLEKKDPEINKKLAKVINPSGL
jgi:HEAT repeat protein